MNAEVRPGARMEEYLDENASLNGATYLLTVGSAYPETTVIQRDAPRSGFTVVTPPVEHRTAVIKRSTDCAHMTVHKESGLGENGD